MHFIVFHPIQDIACTLLIQTVITRNDVCIMHHLSAYHRQFIEFIDL